MIKKERQKEQNISIFSPRLLNFHTIKVVLCERNTLTHEFPTNLKFFLCLSCSQTLYFLFGDRRARVWNKTEGDLLTAGSRGRRFSKRQKASNVCVRAILYWVNVTTETRSSPLGTHSLFCKEHTFCTPYTVLVLYCYSGSTHCIWNSTLRWSLTV